VQREDAVAGQLVVPVRGAVLIRRGQMVGQRIDLRGNAGFLPPGVGDRNERPVHVDEPRVEHRPGQVGAQDQGTEIRLGDRPHAVRDLGERRPQQRGAG
jgi:hypothetical protein